MSDYIKTRSSSAIVIWSILCDHAKTGITLRKIAAYYKFKTGKSMPNNHDTVFRTTMQANDFYIFEDCGKFYPYRDDISGLTFEHEYVNGVVKLVECV